MKHVFLDTNVILDFITKREPHTIYAKPIFELANNNELMIYTSAVSLSNCFYILERSYKKERSEIKKVFKKLLQILHVTNLSEGNVLEALNSNFEDFEDALQNYSAINISDLSIIITRDKSDFVSSELLIVTPEEFLSNLRKE
ncbi:MAG: DNA-binding protein [Flexibacter sp. CG_4_10_14_3_um_filter_32_15]|nr:MAG: DNA-binding protein [Flexibacter sp. CG_4_10_14_3_um_filter_32_15]